MGRASLIIAALVVSSALPALALSCEEMVEPSVLDAANRPAVTGIVERQTVAANPFPWGRSVAAATRVWGDIRVERWQATSRRSEDCPQTRYRQKGTVEYDFAAPQGLWEGPVDGTVETLEVAVAVVVEQRFGAPLFLDITPWDRSMAWLRVFPSLLAIPFLAAIVVGAFRRRRRIGRDYLF